MANAPRSGLPRGRGDTRPGRLPRWGRDGGHGYHVPMPPTHTIDVLTELGWTRLEVTNKQAAQIIAALLREMGELF
jgi:hypothetical protein